MKYYYLLLVFVLGCCTHKQLVHHTPTPAQVTPLQGSGQPSAAPPSSDDGSVPLPQAAQQPQPADLYADAYTELAAMLHRTQPQSFKRAVFLTENAYLQNAFSYQAFCRTIADLAILTKAIGKSNRLSYEFADSVQVQQNYAIYRLLCDTLTFEDGRQMLPYRYDFEDITGQSDWTKLFVSKLLMSGSGNCHSMPYLYRIMAEELHTEASLSLAPNHIYIQTHSQKTGWFNTELTSRTFPRDAWIVASGYISLPTIRNHTYMHPLDLQQSIALCVVDLAKGYQRQAVPDSQKAQFMNQCADLALQHFPEGIPARLLKVEALAALYQQTHDVQVWQELETLAAAIFASGYLEMPEKMYLRWLTQPQSYTASSKGDFLQENQQKGGGSGKQEVLTLSNGQYDEFPQAKPLERIGSVVFDTKAKKVAKLYTADGQAVSLDPVVASRFLSVDPLARSYPYLTPYQFASNTPIAAIDLDGLESRLSTFGNGRTPLLRNPTTGEVTKQIVDVGQFKLEAQRNIDQGLATGQPVPVFSANQFITALEEATTRDGSIGYLFFISHASANGPIFDNGLNVWEAIDRFGLNWYKEGQYDYNNIGIDDIVNNPAIKFEKNALCIFAGCNAGTKIPKGSFADIWVEKTKTFVIASQDYTEPTAANDRQTQRESEKNKNTEFVLFEWDETNHNVRKTGLGRTLTPEVIRSVEAYTQSKTKEIAPIKPTTGHVSTPKELQIH